MSANAQATVTTHACDISVTKTALTPAVCTGATASYSITVRNNSDAFTWTGSVSDDKLGPIATNISLAPGASQTFTKSGTVTGTVTNVATATGSFGDHGRERVRQRDGDGRRLHHHGHQGRPDHRCVRRWQRELHLRGHQQQHGVQLDGPRHRQRPGHHRGERHPGSRQVGDLLPGHT